MQSSLKACQNPRQYPYHKGCPRHYSDLDADWGWDNHEKNWYFGQTFYMLCCRSNAYKTELPMLIKFTSTRRNDSINFLYAIDEFGRHRMGLTPANICRDSAHDNIPAYRLLDHWDIQACWRTFPWIKPDIRCAGPATGCAAGDMTSGKTPKNTAAR